MILKSTLYLASDRTLVVPEGDGRAAFLIGHKGQEIPDKVARKLGLLKDEEKAETAVETRDPEPAHREAVVSRKFTLKKKK